MVIITEFLIEQNHQQRLQTASMKTGQTKPV